MSLLQVEYPTPRNKFSTGNHFSDVAKWLECISPVVSDLSGDLMVTPLYDGVQLDLIYINGVLSHILVPSYREGGLDIYERGRYIRNVGDHIRVGHLADPRQHSIIEVRGQVILRKEMVSKALDRLLRDTGEMPSTDGNVSLILHLLTNVFIPDLLPYGLEFFAIRGIASMYRSGMGQPTVTSLPLYTRPDGIIDESPLSHVHLNVKDNPRTIKTALEEVRNELSSSDITSVGVVLSLTDPADINYIDGLGEDTAVGLQFSSGDGISDMGTVGRRTHDREEIRYRAYMDELLTRVEKIVVGQREGDNGAIFSRYINRSDKATRMISSNKGTDLTGTVICIGGTRFDDWKSRDVMVTLDGWGATLRYDMDDSVDILLKGDDCNEHISSVAAELKVPVVDQFNWLASYVPALKEVTKFEDLFYTTLNRIEDGEAPEDIAGEVTDQIGPHFSDAQVDMVRLILVIGPVRDLKVMVTGKTFGTYNKCEVSDLLEGLGARLVKPPMGVDLILVGQSPNAKQLKRVRNLGIPTVDVFEWLGWHYYFIDK